MASKEQTLKTELETAKQEAEVARLETEAVKQKAEAADLEITELKKQIDDLRKRPLITEKDYELLLLGHQMAFLLARTAKSASQQEGYRKLSVFRAAIGETEAENIERGWRGLTPLARTTT